MKKICCDKCGKDVLPREAWQTGANGMKFHIQACGDYCFHCMIDAVKSLDDRVDVENEKPSAAPFKIRDWVVRNADKQNKNGWVWGAEPFKITGIRKYVIKLRNRSNGHDHEWDTSNFTLAPTQSPAKESVIMPTWEDLPKGQVKHTLWYPEHSKCVFSEFEYNVVRNALQSVQKPKGAA